MRAVLSLVVAAVASFAGDVLLWGGGSVNLQAAQRGAGAGAVDAVPPILAAAGVLLLAVAMLTAAWSSLGVVVVGLAHVLTGLVTLVLPPALYADPLAAVDDLNRSVGAGLYYSWATGVQLFMGVILLVAGIAIGLRARRTNAAAKAVTFVLALVLALGVVPLAVIGGYRTVRALIASAPAIELLGLVLVLGAAVVMAVIAATVRWSSLGVVAVGLLFAAAGGYALVASASLARWFAADPPFAVGTSSLGATGNLLLLGMLLLAAGIAGAVRAVRRRRAAEAAAEAGEDGAADAASPDERIGYPPEQPLAQPPAATASTPRDRDEQPTDDLSRLFPPAGRPRDDV